jgi:hypothetical protein
MPEVKHPLIRYHGSKWMEVLWMKGITGMELFEEE